MEMILIGRSGQTPCSTLLSRHRIAAGNMRLRKSAPPNRRGS
jgi:hypothetical protein